MGGHGQVARNRCRSGHWQVAAGIRVQGEAARRMQIAGSLFGVARQGSRLWLPVLELLHTYFGIAGVDDPPTRRGKVSSKLSALDPTLSDTLPYLFGLLGIQEDPDPLAEMDAQVRKRRTLEAIKRILLRESLRQPLIVIFEDLHWIDSETQALLDLLAESIAAARVLLLVNYRPEYRHEWSGTGHYLAAQARPVGG